jgi:poly(3-hydroxybutyrate) depolymerase
MGRDVWVYAPLSSQLSNQSLPAVVVLHGTADYALSIANTSRFEQLAESSSKPFLAVFPEMSTPGGEMWGYMDDLPFFRALRDSLDDQFPLDRSEVYVCGHSAGGSMSIFLQNNLPSVFGGAAAVEAGLGGLPWWDEESSGRPTMLVWNHNDPVLREFGGEALLNKTLSKLRRHASSADQQPSFSMPVATFNDSVVKRAEQLLYGASGSSPPLAVVSWETVLPTHHWSSPVNVPGSFDASALVWDFFQSTRVFERRAQERWGVTTQQPL